MVTFERLWYEKTVGRPLKIHKILVKNKNSHFETVDGLKGFYEGLGIDLNTEFNQIGGTIGTLNENIGWDGLLETINSFNNVDSLYEIYTMLYWFQHKEYPIKFDKNNAPIV